MTPQRKNNSISDNPLRYLNSEMMRGKESTKEYIMATRKLLMNDLVNQDRQDYLRNIKDQYDQKYDGLETAKDMFEEDLQKFNSMRSEI
jgi:hypothetical protein